MNKNRAVGSAACAPTEPVAFPVDVHIAGRERDASLVRFAAERIARVLGRFRDRVGSVMVRVRDVNGERGGVDQLCSMELVLARGGRVFVTEQADRAERAVARLALRLRRALAERRGRSRARG